MGAIPNKDEVATTLKAVKDARNHLAHGDVSYSNFGSTILLSDIKKYKEDTLDFLSFFINRVEGYISNKGYKKVDIQANELSFIYSTKDKRQRRQR